MRRHRAIAAVFGLSCGHALAAPALRDTELYAKIAHGCHAVALDHWSHPTLAVLAKFKVDLTGVELCNHDTYPIYKVKFRYDTDGPNTAFFDPLFQGMAIANGYWPFAFVDGEFATVIALNDGKDAWNVKMMLKSGHRARVLYINYEPYEATVGAP
jgi:hypothetical protein